MTRRLAAVCFFTDNAWFDDGAQIPITAWLKRNGNDCSPPFAKIIIVGPDENNRFLSYGLAGIPSPVVN